MGWAGMWWQMLDAVAGVTLGCVIAVVIIAIRASARWSVRTWRMGVPAKRVAVPDKRSLESAGAKAVRRS